MNDALARLARAAPDDDMQCWRFGAALVERVRHLLEHDAVRDCARVLEDFVAGRVDRAALECAAADVAGLASAHRGSVSIDGTAHAAVSASHAVAKALAGRPLEAADYAAYAMVYSYSCAAVTDPSAYADEHRWQVETWQGLPEPERAA